MSRQISVIVLCPNGRRETLKISSNSSILQVLEEACTKQNLNSEDFDLWHYKKPLDLSLPIRFANLPNNALLELHPARNSRKDCKVTIALQLESGGRFMKDFQPSTSLSDVIKQCLEKDTLNLEEEGEPVCIYMRQKICGEAIKTTTLRSLGLTQGTAIIRLLYRNPEQLESQAHISSPLTASVPVSLPTQADKTVPLSVDKTKTSNNSENQTEHPLKVESVSSNSDPVGNTMDVYNSENKLTSIVDNKDVPLLLNNGKPNDIKTENLVTDDQSEKMDCGFDIKKENEETSSTDCKNVEQTVDCDLNIKEEYEEIGSINYIGERHAVLYCLDDITDVKKADLPDEFFELTVNDARYLMENYKKERTIMENQPLLTKEQRERNILQKLAQYSQTVIRVYFPERFVLQAVFMVTETVQTVCDFLKNYLENKDLSFYLYTTPPKEKLNNNKNLLESMLVPAAVIYFGCDTQLPNYLLQSLFHKKSDPRAAALAASESRKGSSTSSMQFDIPFQAGTASVKSESSLENVSASANDYLQPASLPKTAKVPKWMKLSKK